MDAKQAAERVYTAIKYNDGKEFWLKEEFGELNEAFYPYTQGLTDDMITQSLTTLQTQGNIYLQKPNVWKAVHDPRLVDKLDYAQPVACPRCGKQTLHLYLYDDWYCIDCLAAKKSQRGE